MIIVEFVANVKLKMSKRKAIKVTFQYLIMNEEHLELMNQRGPVNVNNYKCTEGVKKKINFYCVKLRHFIFSKA